MRTLRKLRIAELDIIQAAEWYENQRRGLGVAFLDAVESIETLLLENPLHYAIRYSDIRRFNLSRFPYGIYFFVDGESVIVLGVLHHRRDTRTVLEERRQTTFNL